MPDVDEFEASQFKGLTVEPAMHVYEVVEVPGDDADHQ